MSNRRFLENGPSAGTSPHPASHQRSQLPILAKTSLPLKTWLNFVFLPIFNRSFRTLSNKISNQHNMTVQKGLIWMVWFPIYFPCSGWDFHPDSSDDFDLRGLAFGLSVSLTIIYVSFQDIWGILNSIWSQLTRVLLMRSHGIGLWYLNSPRTSWS